MNKGWRNGRVGDLISSFESGVSVNGEGREPAEDEYAVLKVSSVTYGDFNQRASKPIFGKELKRAKCTPRAGQIIISRASGTSAHVGASTYINKSYPMRFLSDKLWQTVPNPNIKTNMKWLSFCLASPKIRSRILGFATGTNIKNITKKEFMWIPIQIPPLNEQQEIAASLDLWDNAIKKTEELISAKEKQFGWLTSNLINRANHKRCAASTCMTEISSRNKSNNIIRVLSVTNHSGFVLPEDRFERRVASANVSNYKIVEKGQYAYNPSRINVGSIARLDDWNNGILSPMYVVFEVDESQASSDYFLHWLNSCETRQRIKNSAQGSVRETVSFKDLGAIDIPLPTMSLQKEIVYKLNTAEKEIGLLKKTLEQYRIQKRGLMQKLLTGEWQVSVTSEVTEKTLNEVSA